MEKRSSQPSPRRLRHWLYLLASVPFLLFAAWWFFGAFEHPSSRSAPSPKPSAIASPQNDATARSVSSTDPAERIDTAPQHPPGPNAADFYKNAYGLWKQLTDEEKALLRNRTGKWDPEQAKALFERIQPIIALLHQAHGATYCDWGLGILKAGDSFKYLDLAMAVNSVVVWNANYKLVTDPTLASVADDLQPSFDLARNVSQKAIMGFFTGNAITGSAMNIVRDHASSISPENLAATLALLRTSSGAEDFQLGVQAESDLVNRFTDGLSDPNTLDATLRSWLGPQANDQMIREAKADLPAIIAESQFTEDLFTQFATQGTAPDGQFEAWLAEMTAQAAAYPRAQLLFPVIAAARSRYLSSAVQSTMLTAGLSILQSGDAALGKYPDPATGQPFQLVPTADGFELRSAFQSKGKPVVMTFPTAKP